VVDTVSKQELERSYKIRGFASTLYPAKHIRITNKNDLCLPDPIFCYVLPFINIFSIYPYKYYFSANSIMTRVSQQPQFLLEPDILTHGRLLFRVLNHKHRLKILKLIDTHSEIRVTEIYKKLKRPQSETSMHLALLRKASLVNPRREGRKIFYSVNYKRLTAMEEKARQL
jgi:hypothetical protein